ncbi:hypothetical protein [Yokenella regensburgei]|uniref:hypothetical protein n=1 Tax=Yokenella regensburgei TaxID=158877 RepID=UPI00137605A5|nr:hypothetical protein [Yokenella regensburgei]KAF1368736.1 hypothetical protein FHR25_002486 [Yokenella regensburgei]
MKKACTSFLVSAADGCLLVVLGYGVFTGSSSLVGVTAAAYWVQMFLLIGTSLLLLILSYSVKEGAVGENSQKAVELIGTQAKRRNPVLRGIRWGEHILIVVLLAYAGWVFTGICYALVVMTCRLFISMARENVANLQPLQKKP